MAGYWSGTKKLTLSEVLDSFLVSDEERDLSGITESEDETRDYEDDDANQQLFVRSNVQIFSDIRYFPGAFQRITAFDTDNENESDDDDVSLFKFFPFQYMFSGFTWLQIKWQRMSKLFFSVIVHQQTLKMINWQH